LLEMQQRFSSAS